MESTAQLPYSRHVRSLDGARGVAILLVVVPHIALVATLPGPAIVEKWAVILGHGVEIFFVLSGFCLALPFLQLVAERGNASLDLATYAFNRAFRIVPLYLVAFGLCALLDAVLLRAHQLPAGLAWEPRTWPAQLVFLDHNIRPINDSFWSIPVQLRWYAAFPLLLALYLRSRRAFLALLVAVVVAYAGTRLRTIDLGTLPLFMLGIIAADLHVRDDERRRLGVWLIPLGIAAGHLMDGIASSPGRAGDDVLWNMQPTTLGWQVAAFGFVLAATSDRRLAAVLALRPLAWLGVASFSIYLVHYPIVVVAADLGGPHAAVTAFLAAIAVGAVLWLLAERPISAPALRRAIRARALPSLRALTRAIGLPDAVGYEAPPAPAPRSVTDVPVRRTVRAEA